MRKFCPLFLFACSVNFPGIAAAAPATRAALAFNPGFLIQQKSVSYGISAEGEIYHAPALGLTAGGRVSLRSDLYGFVVQAPEVRLTQNYLALFGLVYNFGNREGFTSYIGFQPGLGFAAVSERGAGALYLYPSLSPLAGAHYFFERQMHLTFSIRYVFGELAYRDTGSVYLSELRAALGLGFFW